MRALEVPRLNSNDDTCRLVEWTRADGTEVEETAVVAVVETSKAAADIHSEITGILHAAVPAGAECRVGEVIGYVFADERERLDYLAGQGGSGRPETGGTRVDGEGGTFVLTEPARRLSEEAGLTTAQLRSLGKRIVQRADVEALAARMAARVAARAEPSPEPSPEPSSEPAPRSVPRPVPTGPSGASLSPRQQAIARVVTRSHQSVPAAFLVMKVYCDALLGHLREWNAANGTAAGVPEAAIRILAGLRPAFPVFFSRLEDGHRLRPPGGRTDIGVTVDVGTGLFVPLVEDAGARGLGEIADRVMELRVAALRDSFRAADLAEGHLSVSLNSDPDVLAAIPLILPPQVCMVSIPSVQTELVLDDETGRVGRRAYLAAGLAYDHRVINGRDAAEFMTAFKAAMERPQEVTW
ncbi:2-oxo acid dehydrogenase subunit E2 [Microbispora sp. NBC_01189]|uniref:2-oxo acid dehydrogenase subunit E2 n=1 Tax=Microbispora sp. NBC_01189 TaxID=2903583 RepID=UPI002E0D282C|nr:2-oxo acid dehydrogenase subunit E2 [Microbispora sp. NBC_01189]